MGNPVSAECAQSQAGVALWQLKACKRTSASTLGALVFCLAQHGTMLVFCTALLPLATVNALH